MPGAVTGLEASSEETNVNNEMVRFRPRVAPIVGGFAAVVALSLLGYALTGVLWGFFRPAYSATILEDGGARIQNAGENVEFVGFAWFVILSSVLASAIALFAYSRLAVTRGFLMFLWLALWTFIGSVVFIEAGEYIVGLFRAVDPHALPPVGSQLEVVPVFHSGIAALCAGPFWAVLVYWCCFVTANLEERS